MIIVYIPPNAMRQSQQKNDIHACTVTLLSVYGLSRCTVYIYEDSFSKARCLVFTIIHS